MVHYNISFAGAGRVAGALCREMYHSGFKILQVVSRNADDGKPLAQMCGAMWSSVLSFDNSNDIIIVAVPDHNLREVISKIKCSENTVIAHTAGSYGLEVFPSEMTNAGVFYPLQTFSSNRIVSLKDVPFLLEASDSESSETLRTLAESVNARVYFVDAQQRRILHVAAVFVNNFINHMLTAGKLMATKAESPFDILTPLIKETISKALDSGPENSQTGPAVRHDMNTVEKHLELLSFSPELQRIYNEMTLCIINYYNNKDNSKQ